MFFLPPFAPISSSISVSFVVCLESFPNIAKLIPLTCFWPYHCQALCKCPKQFKIYFSEGPQMINNNHNDSFKWVSSAFAFKCALMDNCLSEESSVFSPSLSVSLCLCLLHHRAQCATLRWLFYVQSFSSYMAINQLSPAASLWLWACPLCIFAFECIQMPIFMPRLSRLSRLSRRSRCLIRLPAPF